MIEKIKDHHELVIAVSGGKDSTALALFLSYESLLPNPIHLLFCDTGHEHPLTIQHVEGLAIKLGLPLHKAPPKFNFLSLCESKQRFPSTRARFCSEELKVKPTARWLEEAIDSGIIEGEPILCMGIRRDESKARSELPEWQDENRGYGPGKHRSAYDCPIWRPIIDWSPEEVFACHKRHKFLPNPLYLMGARRVGCWPCIHATKGELRSMFKLDPTLLRKIREYEEAVSLASKRGASSFFAGDKTPARFHDKEFTSSSGETFSYPSIDAVYKWCMDDSDQGNLFPESEGPVCFSQYGLCE